MTPIASVMLALLAVWVTPAGEGELVRHVRDAGGDRHVVRLAELVEDAARRWNVDPDLLAALAMHESGFDQTAETEWASGILQVNPRHRVARGGMSCTPDVPGCLEWHIERGAMLLSQALAECDDEWGAVGFYRSAGKCLRREREIEVLRTRLLFRAARCVLDDAARQSLRPGCAAREGLRAEAKGDMGK